MTAMVNRIRTTVQDLIQSLEGEGVQARPHPWLSDCLILEKTGNLERLTAFREGLFYIQDPASRLAVEALSAEPGMRVLDCCAAARALPPLSAWRAGERWSPATSIPTRKS